MVFKQSQKSPKFAHKSQIFSLTVIGQAITKRPKSQILYRKHCVGLKLRKKSNLFPFSRSWVQSIWTQSAAEERRPSGAWLK